MGIRLNFRLPQFSRVLWTGPEARSVWEPRIQKISNAWHVIERLAVAAKIKPATLQTVGPEGLREVSHWALSKNLVCLPLALQGKGGDYTSSSRAYIAGEPFEYRVVIADPEVARSFKEAWDQGDNNRMGIDLGFPECCRRFFDWAWTEEGWDDTTLPMSTDSFATRNARKYDCNTIEPVWVGGPIECNILLRWLGLRLVSHLPCSFNCASTETIGQRFSTLAKQSGFAKEMDWLSQILNWPIEWSSLHGVATITTPIFRLVVDSTPLKYEKVIRRDGPLYPREGAKGNRFPFKNVQSLTLQSRTDYTDNGFSSRSAMDSAHEVIVKAAIAGLGDKTGKIIDLGCGNGILLEKILERTAWIIPSGVERDPAKYQRSARRLLAYDPDLHVGDLFDDHYWNPPYSVAMLSVNRLKEVDEQDARTLLQRLSKGCRKVVLYSYDGDPSIPGLVESFFALNETFVEGETVAHLLEPK